MGVTFFLNLFRSGQQSVISASESGHSQPRYDFFNQRKTEPGITKVNLYLESKKTQYSTDNTVQFSEVVDYSRHRASRFIQLHSNESQSSELSLLTHGELYDHSRYSF